VSEVPIDLIAMKNFLGFSHTPIHPSSRHHQDPFTIRIRYRLYFIQGYVMINDNEGNVTHTQANLKIKNND
jgi:hypothetical protein